jgi:sporulation protein YlmC with PRC-barrel domain
MKISKAKRAAKGLQLNSTTINERLKEKDMTAGASKNTAEKYGVVSASKIIGEAVINRQNETLGKIHELVIDAKEGRVAYAVLSFGGFMGVGNKLFAMPWKAFEFAKTENKLILNVDKEKLKAAPGFDPDVKWPDFADRTWGSTIYKYYGYDPYWNL